MNEFRPNLMAVYQLHTLVGRNLHIGFGQGVLAIFFGRLIRRRCLSHCEPAP